MCRHVNQLRVLAVPLENARHRRLHVGGEARLFGWRQRFSSTEQRHIETNVQAGGFIRLARFANHPAILQLYFPSRSATNAPAQGYVAGAGAPALEFPCLRELQLDVRSPEIRGFALLFRFPPLVDLLA